VGCNHPGFGRVTSQGRSVFTRQYGATWGVCGKPALGPFAELPVGQAQSVVPDWFVEGRGWDGAAAQPG